MALSRLQFVGGAVAVAAATGTTGFTAASTGPHPPPAPPTSGGSSRPPPTPTRRSLTWVGPAPTPAPAAHPARGSWRTPSPTGRPPTARGTPPPRSTAPWPRPGSAAAARCCCRPAYRIDDYLRIGHSGVVLRGAGSGRTTLLATRHLTELIGPYGSRYGGDKSSWSWAGGLVWLSPHARHASLVAAIRDRAWPFEGWTGNRRDEWTTLTALRPARRGDRSVTVEDPSGLIRGQLALLRLADDPGHTLLEHMAGGGPGPEAYTWDDKTKLTSYVPYEWPVRITGIAGRRVTLERPLPLDLRPEWDPRLVSGADPLTDWGWPA
ncbi:hypothetical protein SNARM312S_07937 [Streptomyces narbonensis]